ncbi:TPA: AAA family ATPase [Photobacterium damselae]
MLDKIQIRDLGPISKADVAFKNLTIICGKNSVGKTYLSYSYYIVNKLVKELILKQIRIPDCLKEAIIRVSEDSSVSRSNFKLQLSDFNLSQEILTSSIESKDFTSEVFDSLSVNTTDKSTIDCVLNQGFINRFYEANISIGFLGEAEIQFKTRPNSFDIIVEVNKTSSDTINHTLTMDDLKFISRIFFVEQAFRLNQFPITSERTGISLFYPELDDATRRHLTNNEGSENTVIRYCEPIEDNINSIRKIRNSPPRALNDLMHRTKISVRDQVKALLGGEYEVEKGQLFFRPKDKDVLVPLRSSSGASKSLVLLDYFIQNYHTYGALVIDEPELNLHLDSQKEMARVLCAIANMGIQVIVTTHSDHLIREVNNLIMLSNNKIPEHVKDRIKCKGGIHSSSIIKPCNVSTVVINSESRTTQKMDVSEYGIDLKLFNDEIMRSNDIANDLMMAIYDGE